MNFGFVRLPKPRPEDIRIVSSNKRGRPSEGLKKLSIKECVVVKDGVVVVTLGGGEDVASWRMVED